MAMAKKHLSAIMHLQNGLQSMMLRLKSTTATNTPDQTRPKKPQNPYLRFRIERWSKFMPELHKGATERWAEMSEEAKRPYLESSEAAFKSWKDEKTQIKAKLDALEEEDKIGETEKSPYIGWHLFRSEVQIQGATATASDLIDFMKMASQMWQDLSPEERDAYKERARKIDEKGQKELLASERKRHGNSGRPLDASQHFRHQYMSERMKEAHKEVKREWAELSDEDREVYVKQFEEDTKLYNAWKEEYRAGDMYAGDKRNRKVLKAKIRQIEEDMNKPQFRGGRNPFSLFMVDRRDSLKGTTDPFAIASEMWQALTEEERMEYKAKLSKLNADWQTYVAEWEERNKDNPKMTELKAYKMLLETAKKQGSF